MSRGILSAIVLLSLAASGCSSLKAQPKTPSAPALARAAVLRHAQVWTPVNVRARNLLRGPQGEGAFTLGQRVVCDYVEREMSGKSPKFACRISPKDEVKVKFGGANGEVYGEVLATRLLWSLGFGADRMYPVNVVCRGCPQEFHGMETPGGSRFAPAVIERKAAGEEWDGEGGAGWAWDELDQVDARAGGATQAQRDGLKLLAVFLQHTDSKAPQQRIVCRGPGRQGRLRCDQPLLMLNDVGLTFGRANLTNANDLSGANLARWREAPVWREEPGCVGNLRKSFTGTLENPRITEAGRRFLSDLLMQLSDRQLRDLFESAHVTLRLREPRDATSGFSSVGEWVDVFKQKRREIAARRCA